MRTSVALIVVSVLCGPVLVTPASAVLTTFFDGSQSCAWTYGAHGDTLVSEGYSFTRTMDKDFSPTGRYEQIYWPAGLHVQAITTGPAAPASPQLTLKRTDGDVFDLPTFSIKLLGNTGGAGAALEIMPLINGQDGLPDPMALDATGYYGQVFTYHTPSLVGYDTYQMSIYVDFALTSATADGAAVPEPGAFTLTLFAAAGGMACARRRSWYDHRAC